MGGARLEQVSEFKYLERTLNNQVQTLPSVIGKWRMGGNFQMQSGPWLMLGACSFSVRDSV